MASTTSLSRVASRLPSGLHTLVDVLRWRAERQPEDTAFIFLPEGEDDEQRLSYGELDRRARRIAAALDQAGAGGSRALLVYDSGLDYVAALYGCLYAGVVAVPVYPPDPFRIDRTLPRLRAIVVNAEATWLLATAATLEWARPLFRNVPGMESWLATDRLPSGQGRMRKAASPQPGQPALLQYTSGSTGEPRGVTITHANLMANLRSIDSALDREGNVGVLWTPAYHDMGLIGGIFQPVYSGRKFVFMSPVSFMQRPVRWLNAISRHRATITAAPNFAYDLCVRKVTADERASLDLSCLKAALNGAEMVRPETLERFAETFAECGFRREAFFPCYGMAEATLMVAGGVLEEAPVVRSFDAEALERNEAVRAAPDVGDARRLVGCGQALLGQRVLIVDPQSRRPLSERQIGEIWVAGESIAQGYWNRPEESAECFGAALADDGQGRFLRTGDLGFIDDGELFIAGRQKELIIIQGRNHYPHDIEETVWRSHPLLKSDGGAAFSLEVGGEEHLAVVQEVARPRKADVKELIALIRSQVTQVHGVPPAAVTLIPVGAFPKTSSGKKQRRGCRELFLSDSLPAIGQWRDERLPWNSSQRGEGQASAPAAAPPRTETEKKLALVWTGVLGVEARDIHANFFDLGGQSLLAGQLAARIREEFRLEFPLRTLFTHPTIASLAAWLDLPSDLRKDDSLPPVTCADRSLPLPLSSSQEQLWFLEQLETTPRYNLSAAILLRGPLDLPALQRSLSAIVARHEALRTIFPAREGKPEQAIGASWGDLPRSSSFDDLGRSPHGSELEKHATQFNLATGPLWRTSLERLSETEHRLLITAHHLICDGWSLAILLKELAALYAADVAAQPAELGEVVWQYADFAAWQQICLASPHVARQLDYWKSQLEGAAPLELVADYTRTPDGAFRGAAVRWEVGQRACEALVELSRREGATLYMTMLAAFQTLLARFSRQNDVCVGSPVSYRPRREFEDAIGYFVNTLVLRSDLSGEPTFRQLLARVRETALDAFSNQDAPLRAVVDAVAPRREAGRSPLFNVMFVFENLPWRPIETAGLSLGEIELDHTSIGSFDLALVIEEQQNSLKASFVYNAELFDPAVIEHMAAAFKTLLAAVIREPDQSVMRLGSGEWERGRGEEGERRRDGGTEGRSRALATSLSPSLPLSLSPFLPLSPSPAFPLSTTAIVAAGHTISYGELHERANQLARCLQAMGVGPETPVAVFLDRSAELVVAMLAVLKAGGAYVPFDPQEAPERLAAMLDDTRPRAVITSGRLAERLPPHEAEEISLDRDWDEIARQPATVLDRRPAADSLAYIIYTSGSTGRPKGVEVTRAALANLAAAMADRYELSKDDRVLQLISPAFDVAGEEIFPALLRSASLVLGPPAAKLTGRSILDVCRRERVTVAHIPPLLLQQCLLEWQPADEALFEHLRVLVIGGEPLPADALNRWLELSRGRVRLLHEYGLTETTVTNLVYELPAELNAWPVNKKLPVGRPVAGAEVYVLDEHRQPLPVGAPGELYLGGPGLARGYHRRLDDTREVFVEHPFNTTPGARLCRTGDLARWLPDGNLEFLGRGDEQIKLRGLRIEPGEIERVLARHPAVGEAAVIARNDAPGGKQLVAYVVPANGRLPEGPELRAWLRGKLPDSMVPAAFVPLRRLPLNRSHKLDREALPAPSYEGGERRTYAEPRNDVERTLTDIWRQILQVERVGIDDNFFELGGDSILTIQVVARAREAGLRFTPRQLFERQTIAELAAVEGAESAEAAEQGQVEGHAPLTPIQQWFLTADVVEPQHFNQAMLFKVDATLDPRYLSEALERLVEQHDALRLRFKQKAAEWRQWHGPAEGAWPLENFDLSQLPQSERQPALTAAAAQVQANLNLDRGPLARAAWFDLGGGQTRLLLVVHHLVIDAMSWKFLLEDLLTLWSQLQRGQPPALPPKTTSFKQWADRLLDYAQSFELQNEVAFWRRLADQPAVALPRDFESCGDAPSESALASGVWDAAQTAELLERANAAYRTRTNEILLAALAQTLAAWGCDGAAIDVEGHGRGGSLDDLDLSRTVGWFTAWQPLSLQAQDLAPGALLRQTKESLRRAPNQGLGFGALRYLSADPEIRALMASLPLPEISFNYLGRVDQYLPAALLTPADEPTGPTRSPRAAPRHALQINAYVLDGRLHVDWTYWRRFHRPETIERLAADFLRRLGSLAAHCLSPDAGGFTPSDFPLAKMTDGELAKLSGLLGE